MSNVVRVTDDVFTIPHLLTGKECEEWIGLSESAGYEPARLNLPSGPRRLESMRNNARVVYDDPVRADQLWRRVANDVPQVIERRKAVGLNERLRFYRYDVGQRFKWHKDECFHHDNGQLSLVTFMVYLNDGFTGGETCFREFRIEPQVGMGLLFVHWQRHMGAEVRSGRKYVLRSDVMYAKVECDRQASSASTG